MLKTKMNKKVPVINEKKNNENPYLMARRTWNENATALISSRQTWQFIGIMSLLLTLVSISGMIYIGSQSKFIPYVVEVDKFGSLNSAGTVKATSPLDTRILKATVAEFIENARRVTPDVALQRKAIFNLYAHLTPNEPATAKMNDWFNHSPTSNPFARATKEMVSTHIESILQLSPDSWQVDWVETTRNRQGVLVEKSAHMRAVVTLYVVDSLDERTQEQISTNPLGIYIRNFTWSKLQ